MAALSSSPKLFVPIELQGIIVNQDILNQVGFAFWTKSYDNFLYNFESPSPQPFGNLSKPQEGVYLKWILPTALTRGSQEKLLFNISSGAIAIVNNLNKGTIDPTLKGAFKKAGCQLSESGVTISQTEENLKWLIIDWSKGARYLIQKSSESSLTIFNASISFPKVPNRWLVTRLQKNQNQLIPPQSWIIQSDHLDPNNENGIEFLDPFSEKPQKTLLGKSEALTTSWKEPNPDQLFLQAVGLGDVTFSVYAPSVMNVFSFRDPTVLDLPENTELSYSIIGWYSKLEEDPLQGVTPETWCERLKELSWSLSQQTGQCQDPIPNPLPQNSLFHGAFHSLMWQSKGVPGSQNPNTLGRSTVAKNVRVAIGNTSIDALTALVRDQANRDKEKVNARLLEAFQYGLLDSMNEPDGMAKVQNAMRQAWYGSIAGGLYWKIVSKEEVEGGDSHLDLAPYAAALEKLNLNQQEYEQASYRLQAMQWTLYARWFKGKRLYDALVPPDPGYPGFEEIKQKLKVGSNEYNALISQIQTEQNHVNQLASVLPNPHDPISIANYAKNILKLPDTFVMKPIASPRFWHPNDPVVLVSGLGSTLAQSSPELLQCRLSTQLIPGIKVSGKVLDKVSLKDHLPQLTQNSFIPSESQEICTENFFLDPNNAPWIAKAGLADPSKSGEVQQAVENKQWSDLASVEPASCSLSQWKQGWMPLFLEWEIAWYPSFKQEKDDWIFDRENWKFNGQDYEWHGQLPNIDHNNTMKPFIGRTFLTDQASVNFEARLQQYLKDHPNPDLEKLEKLLKELKGWDLLSQSLSGLFDQLVMQLIDQNIPPDSSIAQFVQDQYHTITNPAVSEVDGNFPYFFPQKAGFFIFKQLRVIDRFGQFVDLLYANNNDNFLPDHYKTFKPIRADHFVPDKDANPSPLIELRMGTIQASRLDFRWVDSTDDKKEIGCSAQANPVCGWLLPNHLDNGLTIYDQDGKPLGEMIAVEGTQEVDWEPTPGSPQPIVDPKEIQNIRLRSFVTGLVGKNRQKSFENFMEVIDETLWFVDPLGGRNDQHLSVLIGRPLVLVRAMLQFSAMTKEPLYNQGWMETFEQEDGGFSKVPFNIGLGSLSIRSDGLLGYYLDQDSFTKFNAVHVPSSMQNDPYIDPIGGDKNNYLSSTFSSEPIYLTLLLDPRGSVHASTGIFPVKEISLPSEFIDSALQNMEVTFRVGPIITDPLDSNVLRLIQPRLQRGEWSWIEKKDPSTFQTFQIKKEDGIARIPDAPEVIREGWLKLEKEVEIK